MHYLQKELNRLVKYAEALNIKVSFSNKDPGYGAEWSTDGKTITIFKANTKKPLELVLTMYHELSHHLSWVYKGRKGDLKTDHILNKVALGRDLTELQRKHIYEDEKFDYQYQYSIHKEIDSKIPLWRLEAEIALDEWIYKYYWQHAKWPLMKERKAKAKELRDKHRSK